MGKVLPAETLTPDPLREAVREVLRDPTHRERAHAVRQEMLDTPGPEYAIELLERLAREKEPVLAAP